MRLKSQVFIVLCFFCLLKTYGNNGQICKLHMFALNVYLLLPATVTVVSAKTLWIEEME